MTQKDYFDRAMKQTELTDEAKETLARIEREFIERYYGWHRDIAEMDDRDFGFKYGWSKPRTEVKDNLSGVVAFLKHGWAGRWMPGWEKAGYDKFVLWELVRKGFLSCQEYSNWEARHTGRTEWVYISQARAKEIYKAYKAAN